jgi:hypothetical protein
MQISEEDARDLAINLISPVEKLLDKHNIKVPDEDRSGDDTEACLYGETHAILEDDLVQLIKEHMLTLGEKPETILDPQVRVFLRYYDKETEMPVICLPEEVPAFERKFLDDCNLSSVEEYETYRDETIDGKDKYEVMDNCTLSTVLSGHLLAHIITNATLEYPVRGMLDVSTVHFPKSDFDILNNPKTGIIYPYGEGWITYVFNEDIDNDVDPEGISASYKKAANKARKLGCSFMMIDHDAAEHDDLDEYDHSNESNPIKVTSQMFEVNTAHLTLMDIGITTEPTQCTVFENNTGWILHLDDNIPVDDISDNLAIIINKALNRGCKFIFFGDNAPVHEDLDTHR